MRLRYLCFILPVLLPGMLQAQTRVEFSADAVMSHPQQQQKMVRKMNVGKTAVRTEANMQGKSMIQVIDLKTRTARMLFPDSKTYFEIPGDGAGSDSLGDNTANPCDRIPQAKCTSLGAEDVNGRKAVKWQIQGEFNGQTYTAFQWLDQQRHLPVRQLQPNGASIELALLGQEKLNGRLAEKWQVTTTQADGKEVRLMQWYDPQIRVTVREEMPNGYVNELINIKVGQQDASLFQVPAGYRQVQPPARPGQAQGVR